MLAVDTMSSTARTALKLISATAGSNNSVETSRAPGLDPVSAFSLPPRISDALLNIQQLASGRGSDEAAPSKATVSAQAAEWFRSLGADDWVVKDRPQLGDEALKEQVLAAARRNGTERLAGFSEALANGTLKIQRASELPEYGFRTVQVDLYEGGSMIGGAVHTESNAAYWLEQRKAGTFLSGGSINGTDYVISWAMPWEADNSWLGTGIYANTAAV